MAEQKMSFPILPEKWWWSLRNQFKKTIPQSNVKSSYLATVLNIGQDTAAKIALPAIRKVGLIDQSGKPSERAVKWRDDKQYPEVCKEILREIYPQELLEAVPEPASDRAAAERWFANVTGSGKSAITKMVSFYQLLCEADPNKQKEAARRPSTDGSLKTKPPKNGSPVGMTVRKSKSVSTAQHGLVESTATTSDIPPALEMLVRSLPPEGTSLPGWRRKQWLRMASEVLAFMYPNDEDEELEEHDAKG